VNGCKSDVAKNTIVPGRRSRSCRAFRRDRAGAHLAVCLLRMWPSARSFPPPGDGEHGGRRSGRSADRDGPERRPAETECAWEISRRSRSQPSPRGERLDARNRSCRIASPCSPPARSLRRRPLGVVAAVIGHVKGGRSPPRIRDSVFLETVQGRAAHRGSDRPLPYPVRLRAARLEGTTGASARAAAAVRLRAAAPCIVP